ncbi:CAP domain-containing protein [Gehongia tenuis]|uniref:SCP domain-containing protein n=1 Tax=Gehongia tenuis TaxID=2763655 RepID=A0A926D3I7_9FIRM|nr:CAP domain-containing protein [Gehongia tenuis]MBC8530842.1 hypothetical protein [Gehongia tenuis]
MKKTLLSVVASTALLVTMPMVTAFAAPSAHTYYSVKDSFVYNDPTENLLNLSNCLRNQMEIIQKRVWTCGRITFVWRNHCGSGTRPGCTVRPSQNPCPTPSCPAETPVTPPATPSPTPTQSAQPSSPVESPVVTPEPSSIPAETPAATPTPSVTPAPTVSPEPSLPSSSVNSYETELLALVNEDRVKNGLSPYTLDPELCRIARLKAQDMADNNYFAHESPTYGKVAEMLKTFGYSYRAAGENIAKYGSIEKAHLGLMNSEGHRKNLLSSGFTQIGIGVVKKDNYFLISEFFALK